MAKFSGVIGFVQTVETSPGVWTDQTTERRYKGDLIKDYVSWNIAEKVNLDLNLNNQVRIVADNYILQNTEYMKYVVVNGVKWKVINITINRPRLIISLGGIYRNEQSSTGTT